MGCYERGRNNSEGFLFLCKQSLYANFGGREKKRNKEENFYVFQKCLDTSVLIYCTLQELIGKVGDILFPLGSAEWNCCGVLLHQYSGE